jgi:glycosyltransferase involved in cell wall biosynthesis
LNIRRDLSNLYIMKLIIQIPCCNEEKALPVTLRDLPSQIPGIDTIEILVIDDGSTDRTADVAREHGVHHIVRLTSNQGLAKAFSAGISACLKHGADIIVNTDGDNQYKGEDIARLVQPILEGKADIVVGARDIDHIVDFSAVKKFLQRVGSSIMRKISQTSIPDMTSGFRAYSKEGALRMNVVSDFTYTLETIIQAGIEGIAITHVPVQTNQKLRESRLFSSNFNYVRRSIGTILRIYLMYEPLKVFGGIGGIFISLGSLGILRFIYFYFSLPNVQTGHIQSVVISTVLFAIGWGIVLFGLLADITAKNRKLLEEVLLRVKRFEANQRDGR